MSHRRKPSSFLLTLRLRSQTYWASWRLSRIQRQVQREQRRTQLLQLSLDSSLLRQKELEQREEQLLHRQQEMADSWAFRTQGLVPEPEPEQPLLPQRVVQPLLEQLAQPSPMMQVFREQFPRE